jgi:hypothetical protein
MLARCESAFRLEVAKACATPASSRQDAAFGLGAPFLRQDKLKTGPYNFRAEDEGG